MPDHDPSVRRELLAVTLNVSAEHIKRDCLAGKIPRPDTCVDGKIKGWRLSTLEKWNPRVGQRLKDLLSTPYLPAA